MTRAYTGKTPLYICRYRYYWYLFVLMSPIIYGLTVYMPTPGFWYWLWMPLTWFVTTSLILGYFSFLTPPLSRILCNLGKDSDFDWWVSAGGHSYWDGNTWCNFDRAVVRAAIGRPPENDYCANCGADLRGTLNLGGNFGNCCNTCGLYNDTFDAGDPVAYEFGRRIGAIP